MVFSAYMLVVDKVFNGNVESSHEWIKDFLDNTVMMREGVGFILACIRMTEPYTKKQLMLSLASIFIDQDQIMPNTTSSEGSLNMVMNKQHNVNLVYVILQSIRRLIKHKPDPESL